jgi:hypothetical protein
MKDLFKLILGVLASLFESRTKLEAEILILRQQINGLRRQAPKRPHLNNTDRFLFVWLYHWFPSVLGTIAIVSPTPAGQTLSGDHTYVQFQIPVAAKQNSALMWGSFVGNSWETTPDGREGFEQIFLRRGWSVYVADRPRMGRSARTTVGTTITPTAGDQGSFIQFRLGIWPNLYPDSKFPPGPYALDQFRRWGVQSVGPGDACPFRKPHPLDSQ